MEADDYIPAASGISASSLSSPPTNRVESPATFYISIDVLVIVRSYKITIPKPLPVPRTKKTAAPKKLKSVVIPPKLVVFNVMKHMFIRDDGTISCSDSVKIATIHFRLRTVLEKLEEHFKNKRQREKEDK
uniref:Uncharacterized protein n=1 Tax=Corethron hystrix TaxID=216773 RepID=A0A6U5KEK6_9STRA|mmetsp:Transcript_40392/g.94900  ORF Transcript_40392/g.94900 Transcript_40392/m.94900 type:complete len:131 (+) Transcript_40392:811-1203(+)|eukprot:CAMPEP_0113298554 /NCGR_PEP_ID=MMETSP0010_2-20120614/949_1 /TAXON_ID=216773 ORGANISM="Corethron hystrix, Strain 308" /NCGR_SAMPLE_ID=MMETSP0010_2 /ASSEMBLY_ACC=CAM_ASM_000155 /LENGTH=130 /DNA_ID=CAMNT_0000151625 /DNA_START=234 /DNA_END=626 /DNA_ORIENTATION=+ /assembly_acc=CAM_ASM_000155